MKKLLMLIAVCTLISGCRTTEKKAKGWAYSNKHKLAEWCLDCFGDKQEPVYQPGKTITKVDTVRDSVKVMVDCPDGSQVQADCPSQERITIDNSRVDTIYNDRPATLARLEVAEAEIKQQWQELLKIGVDLSEMTESRDKYRKWFWIMLGIVGVYVLLKINRVV